MKDAFCDRCNKEDCKGKGKSMVVNVVIHKEEKPQKYSFCLWSVTK